MVETKILYILATKHNKDTKNWYTIDALGAIFAIFIKVVQYLYNTFTMILQYF